MSSNPTFADIVALLNTLVPLTDSNINDAPHLAFWRNTDRDSFIAITTDQWGVAGPLVTPGTPSTSNLYLALAGKPPFDGSQAPQMPYVAEDPKARLATAEELTLVEEWIKNNAPA